MTDVVLAEPLALVRIAFHRLIESAADLRVVGTAVHGQEAIEAVDRLRPHVLALNLMVPGVTGFDVVEHVAQAGGPTRTVVFAPTASDTYAVEALRAGALGYVSLDACADDFHRAIRDAAQGRRFASVDLSERARQAVEAGDGARNPLARLSPREWQMFHLAVEGLSNAQAAERLFISPRTAEKHRARFLKKLGLRTQGDLVRFAAIHRLLPGIRAERQDAEDPSEG